jgi:phosphoglycerate dehydrogenase-like enzyme
MPAPGEKDDMTQPTVLIRTWLGESALARLGTDFPQYRFVDARVQEAFDSGLPAAEICYGLPPVARLAEAPSLRWLQLVSAGVPRELCRPARQRAIRVTNLAGLYGPSIAQHALALMLMLTRNLHVVLRNQHDHRWDRSVAQTMSDLNGRTLAIVGLGNIGQAMGRLGRSLGMRVVGCRRTDQPAPLVDQLYPLKALRTMLAEADFVVVAAPLTDQTDGMLGPAEFEAMKPGVFFINVSRGSVAQEKALLEALQSGHVAGAGLDVYAIEPLPGNHPFWSMPQVIVTPHYSGETVNNSGRPAERFARNLHAYAAGLPLEGTVNLEWGY